MKGKEWTFEITGERKKNDATTRREENEELEERDEAMGGSVKRAIVIIIHPFSSVPSMAMQCSEYNFAQRGLLSSFRSSVPSVLLFV